MIPRFLPLVKLSRIDFVAVVNWRCVVVSLTLPGNAVANKSTTVTRASCTPPFRAFNSTVNHLISHRAFDIIHCRLWQFVLKMAGNNHRQRTPHNCVDQSQRALGTARLGGWRVGTSSHGAGVRDLGLGPCFQMRFGCVRARD